METVSVIIPAYNEEKRIGRTLNYWVSFLKESNLSLAEIIIVDDGSSDSTLQIAESFKTRLPIKTIKIENNQGKGNAVKTGVIKSAGDIIFIYDADAAAKPDQINKLLKQIDIAEIVIGSRVANGSKTKISLKRKFVGLCFRALCFSLLPNIKDASCGAKIFTKDAAKKIFELQKIKRFAYDIEDLWLAQKLNFKIKEVGIEWEEIPNSKVKVLRDGSEMFFAVLGIYKRQLFG
jgi:dolichyl-phosphate beta-glucosyltransferase